MRNKKAWLRIAEAFIAILLITGVMVFLYSETDKPSKSAEVYNVEKVILDEIAFNESLRSAVLNNDTVSIKNFVAIRIPAGFNFTINICDVDNICGLVKYKEGVFASEGIISSNLTSYKPKKIKIFMWLEE